MVTTTLTKEAEIHERNLKTKHRMYCPKCDKFVTGTLTDAGVYGYFRHCPIHGIIE